MIPSTFGGTVYYHNRLISIMQDAAKNREQLELFGDSYLKGGLLLIFIVLNLIFIFALVSVFIIVFTYKTVRDIDRMEYGKT